MNNTDHSEASADQHTPARSSTSKSVTIVSIVLGLAASAAMTLAMFWIGDYYRGDVPPNEQRKQKAETLRATERRELTTYGWLNREKGQVRIPVERAMQLLVDEARDSPGAPPYSKQIAGAKVQEDKPADDPPEDTAGNAKTEKKQPVEPPADGTPKESTDEPSAPGADKDSSK